MKGNAIDLVGRHLDIAIAQSEYKRIKFFIGALFLGLIIMLFNFFVIKETTSFFKYEYTKFLVVSWFVTFLTYEIIGYFIAGKFLRKKTVVPYFMKVGNVTIEAAFPGILLFVLCYVEHSVIFLDSPLMFFYFILIVISSLNLDRRLVMITGLVSAGGYLLVTIWAIASFDSTNQVLYFPPILYMARSMFMMIAALGSMFVASEIKKRALKSFEFIQQKNNIEMLFGQQVSKKVADALVSNNFISEKRVVSILFFDIRKFSVFAESKDPSEVIEYQNNIFSPLVKIINQFNGITNQIMGDGLMATFGAPALDDEHSENAIKAGLSILDKIRKMSETGIIPKTTVGIGIHRGSVVMGNIGNELRKQFSISGSTVIIAARLEQVNKDYNTQLLVSKELYENIDSSKYQLESIGKIKVRNIEKDIQVYKVA